MSTRRVKIVILCEDSQHEAFIRRFLGKTGWNINELRVEKSPSAGGSAEQRVREQFPIELDAFRKQRARTPAIALITMIDADLKSVCNRIQDFKNECASQGIQFREADDAVAIGVPKRNIETWIHFLNGNQVNENVDYKKLVGKGDCKPAANNLVQRCNNPGQFLDVLPDSLTSACTEYNNRIRPLRG